MKGFLGPVIVICSVILYASLGSLLKKANHQLPPFMVMAISMGVLAISSFILTLLTENHLFAKINFQRSDIFLLIAVGLINTLGFWLAILGYKYMPLWQQSMFGLLTPIFVGIFAYFILGEAISPKLFLGLIIMGTGLYIAVR